MHGHRTFRINTKLREMSISQKERTNHEEKYFAVADRFVVLATGRKILDVDKEDVTPEQLTEAIIGEADTV